jgi:primase-polymerase (primpol)-like protein
VRYSARKVPLTTTGRAASSTNPGTWTTYSEAAASKAGVGVGFVLNGDGLACLDLDHCLEDGKPTPAARRFLYKLPRTYIEVSPSGTGLHVWGFAEVPTGRHVTVDGLSVEVYGRGRYLTVTGEPFAVAPLADLSAVVANIT